MEHSVVLNILLFYAILFFANLPAPILGLSFDEGDAGGIWFAPPGYVIAIVWWILFTLLGIAHYYVLRDGSLSGWANGGGLLIGLAVLCATYVYYTLGLSSLTGISSLWFGLFGNLLVILCAAFVVWRFYQTVPTASFLTVPVILWTTFATLIVIAEMKSARLI